MKFLRFTGLALCALAAGSLHAQNDWPTYGHDGTNTRHSPLKQIDARNVGTLQRAWTYHMTPPPDPNPAPQAQAGRGGRGGGGRGRTSEASPIVVGGVMYLPTPFNRVVALEPETGKEIWNYEIPGNASASTRGVEYWPGDGQSPASIFFGTTNGRLMALNAKTGQPIPGFGNEGWVDMRQGIDNGFPSGQFSLSSPPKVFKNVIITGARVQESPSLGYSGDTRGWDAHTGKLLWQFHSVPRPGETGSDTWKGDDWKNRSGLNVWGLISVDTQLGLVYLPYGSASYDFYGADREGANLFGNSLVALDAQTGRLKWYYQLVHHDLWDYDLESAPILFEMTRNGQKIPAVAITSKAGLVFMLDRRTGKPLYDVKETPVPQNTIAGEHPWPTEPVPVKPAPLSRMSFKGPEEIAKVTPEQEKFCTDLLNSDGGMSYGGPFNPYTEKTTINFPGTWGATNWHGGSYDPELGYLFYNTEDLADTGKLQKQAPERGVAFARNGFQRFWNPDNFWPCQQPPWGEMVAINVNTGEYAWRVPFGIIPELEAKGVKNTGTLNMGGSATTGSGLVFIGASNDRHFRAFDGKTGKVLWDVELDAGAYASPIVYQGKDGKEYVTVVATGGQYMDRKSGDSVVTFALPK
jgi:quinoprotein glucose dehydrogenase